ncbi:MAG: helix-turn-helix domain-containing protein [Desulfobulbaceae bacterium]|nr:helix-turn-helix domain-containing protein [Desulfobulbaceae bacterium]
MIGEDRLSLWLDIPKKTLQYWRVSGKGPPFAKLGYAVRYRVGSVRKWIEKNTVSSRLE